MFKTIKRFCYQNKQFKFEHEAKYEVASLLIAGHIDSENEARVEYIGGSKPYIITLIETES